MAWQFRSATAGRLIARAGRRSGATDQPSAGGRHHYTQLERYLAFLGGRGLVLVAPGEDGASRVSIAPTGREALAYLARAIREVLREEFVRRP